MESPGQVDVSEDCAVESGTDGSLRTSDQQKNTVSEVYAETRVCEEEGYRRRGKGRLSDGSAKSGDMKCASGRRRRDVVWNRVSNMSPR